MSEILRVENISKYFGGVAANDDISFSLQKSEILAILGENGAGKSTFCKMLTGVYHPDQGQIFLEGQRVDFVHPSDSIKAGISMVYQERNLVGMLTGAQNICLGHEPTKRGLLNDKAIEQIAEDIERDLNISVPLHIPAEQLGAGEQQLIEILRALQTNPKLLILDEPTASLGAGEIEPFLKFIKNIKENTDIAVIFISHKIEEVFELADTIAVFTDGKNVLFKPKMETNEDECISAMLRSDKIEPVHIEIQKKQDNISPVLQIEKAFYDKKEHELNFAVYPKEIVGFYGLVGSGRTECVECLYGLRHATQMNYLFNGETIVKPSPRAMIRKGMVLTPEMRSNGLFRSLSLTDNISNMFLSKLLYSSLLGIIDRKKSRDFALQVLVENDVRYKLASQPVGSLSGGNMQKIIIGRSVAVDNIKLLILDEPTTGMDIGAKYQVYHKLVNLTEQTGLSIMMISSELDELLATCHRIYIFANGHCIEEFTRECFDKRKIIETAVRGRRL